MYEAYPKLNACIAVKREAEGEALGWERAGAMKSGPNRRQQAIGQHGGHWRMAALSCLPVRPSSNFTLGSLFTPAFLTRLRTRRRP